jgi:flagellar hook protein FlgE
MSFNVALTGLNAANQDLSVTSNNLANTSTVGFKGSRTEFSDLFASTQFGVSSTTSGNGVSVQEVAQQFSQGDIETTGNNLDLAISGNGFFTTSDNGALQYTRDGEFQINSTGDVVTASGANLQVYPPLATGGYNTGGLQNLSLSTGESPPAATTTASITANLPADATVPADSGVVSPTDANSYNNTTSMTVYDSLGAAHTASLYFTKTATNTWTASLYVDGNAVGQQQLTYSASGDLVSPTAATPFTYTAADGLATGANDMDLAFNFGNVTQFGNNFGVTAVQQNGYTTGLLTGISIDDTGVVQAQYTNGNSVDLGQVAMANFANSQGLSQVGNNSWAQTNQSGEAVQGVAGGSGFGSIASGSLEESNVDTTTALVDMITAQRAFQANAQMIQTENSISQTIIQVAQT